MKEKFTKKVFRKPSPKPWKPPYTRSLPQKAPQPQIPKPETILGKFNPREQFEPVISRPVELDLLAAEISLQFQDIDGLHEIKTCCGDIYKIVNALMDYARMLEMVCDEWDLQGFYRATYEYHAEKLRDIAKKYQAGIGYDYEAAVERCKAKKNKPQRDDDVGGDAMELALKKARQEQQKKESR